MGLAIITFPVAPPSGQTFHSHVSLEVKQFCWLHFIIKPGKVNSSSVSATQRLLNQISQTRQTIVFLSVRSTNQNSRCEDEARVHMEFIFWAPATFSSGSSCWRAENLFQSAPHFSWARWNLKIWYNVQKGAADVTIMFYAATCFSSAQPELFCPGRTWWGHGPDRTRDRRLHQQLVSVSSSSSHLSSLQPVDGQESLMSLAASSRVVLWFNESTRQTDGHIVTHHSSTKHI